MNTKTLFFIFCLLMISLDSFADNRNVKGNGTLITQEIAISDYEEISVVGNVDFRYEQSDATPFLEITIDENLLPLIQAKVEGKSLIVGPKDRNGNGNSSYSLNPTSFLVKTNSRNMKEMNVVTSGSVAVTSPLKISRLEINMAGSGTVRFNKIVEGNKLECNLAGSGEIVAKSLKVESVGCSVAGSGSVEIGGNAERASYSVASSGSIQAFHCKVRKADCSVAGSGTIEANTSDYMDGSVVGSGNIHYEGNPEVSQSVMGSGSVEKVN